MSTAEHRIGLVGISTRGGPVGPDGNHLRWSFPRELGFPKAFAIHRKWGHENPKTTIGFPGALANGDVVGQLEIDGVVFIVSPSGSSLHWQHGTIRSGLTITPESQSAQLELRFPQPVAHIKIEIVGLGSSIITAYHDRRLKARILAGLQPAEIYCAGITRLTIGLGSRRIASIAYATDAEICNDKAWQQIAVLAPPIDSVEGLLRFEEGLKNYYASSPAHAGARYGPRIPEIILWLNRLRSPTSDFFADPTAPPHLLKTKSPNELQPSSATYLQSACLLTALDPNIARLMSLYWVDAFERSGQSSEFEPLPPPDRDQSYDYKVEGFWEVEKAQCGLLLNLGPPQAPLPSLKEGLQGEQIGGLHWLDDEPHGRIGLKWTRPEIVIADETRFVAPVQPVLYDVKRTYENKGPEPLEPVLVDQKSWNRPHLYIDRNLRIGSYVYEVSPIDIFGQLGAPIRSAPITVFDLQAPPPPIRVRVANPQAGPTVNLHLQFEFGASQHQQAPDVKEFTVYWRPDTLFTRALVRVEQVTSQAVASEKFIHTVRMRYEDQLPVPLEIFVGDVLTNVISGADPPLRANQRRRYRVAEDRGGGVVVLEPTTTGLTSGVYELIQEPHNRHHWAKLQEQPLPARGPITGELREVEPGVPVRVVSRTVVPQSPNPFASVPPERRGRQFPYVPPTAEVVEVEIDRLLIEPDVFAGGSAQPAFGNAVDIKYVVSNPAAGRTRIALPAGTTVAPGDILTLSPPSELSEPPSEWSRKIRLLQIAGTVDQARLATPGGEIAFQHRIGRENVKVIMRVISNAVNDADSFNLVVRADTADDLGALRPNATSIDYFAPYVLPSLTPDAPPLQVSLPLAPSDGYRDGFIAVSATDISNNQGPLSTPVQFSVIRPKPGGALARPYPCGRDSEAEGYASPPNRAGRATVCLRWETGSLDPAEGVRYEVARALDNSILTAHLRAWQMGKTREPLALPMIAGALVEGDLSDVSLDETGLIHATFTPAAPISDPTIFRNGRLKLRLQPPFNMFLQVTSVEAPESPKTGAGTTFTPPKVTDTSLKLLLRDPSRSLSVAGPATLEAPPNYSDARNDIPTLQALALEAPDAFALVTGVPIDNNRFIDDVAGKGRNRFFYRVRAVDAAENRSEWSNVSNPFHQVDTTPPEAPREFQLIPGDRKVTLSWSTSPDPTITSYRVYRSAPESDFDVLNADVYAELNLIDLERRRLLPIAGSVVLPRPLKFEFASDVLEDQITKHIAARLVVQEFENSTNNSNLFDRTVSRLIFETVINKDGTKSAILTAVAGLLPSTAGAALKVIAGPTVIDGDPLVQTWTDSGLRAGVTYSYRLSAVRTVRATSESSELPFRELPIVGKTTDPITIKVSDLSVPQAPIIFSAEWVDLDGVQLTRTAANARVRLIVNVLDSATRLLVQRRATQHAPWTNPPFKGTRGWQDWPAGLQEFEVIDPTADPAIDWTYRALIGTADGRQSGSSAVVLVARLAP